MHKGVILLMKADTPDEAIDRANNFLMDYCHEYHGVCDWYEIGGQWSGILKPYIDAVPLSECIDCVKKFGDIKKRIKELEKEAHETKEKGMKGFYLSCLGNLLQQNFCFDTNVFNIEQYDYSIPKSLNGWYAVIGDMHC